MTRSDQWRQWLGLSLSEVEVQSRVATYQQLVQGNPFPVQLEPDEPPDLNNHPTPTAAAAATTTSKDDDIDPLTAYMMEEQRKQSRLDEMDRLYRARTTRRKVKGSGGGGGSDHSEPELSPNEAALHVLDADLQRLPPPFAIYATPLREILFLYNNCHRHHHDQAGGYRQGMHEVAAHLYHVLQQDLDSNHAIIISSECYALLCHILEQIAPAYDIDNNSHNPTTASNNNALQAMSQRIMNQTARADPQFQHRLLLELQVPPAIYLTKWMRLLFGRDVLDVEALWDVLFQLASNPTQQHNLMDVLEATAAARLLHHRATILRTDNHDLLHFLMNIPVETDLQPILDLTRALLLVGHDEIHLLPPLLPSPVVAATASLLPPPPTSTPSLLQLSSATPDALLLSMKRFSISQQVKEIASKTQTMGKRLYHEWEQQINNAAATDDAMNHHDWAATTRSYDDHVWHYDDTRRGSSAPPQALTATTTQQQQQPLEHFLPHHHWGPEMELPLAILQNFVMTVEKQHPGTVPQNVWIALADLEVLRQEIGRSSTK